MKLLTKADIFNSLYFKGNENFVEIEKYSNPRHMNVLGYKCFLDVKDRKNEDIKNDKIKFYKDIVVDVGRIAVIANSYDSNGENSGKVVKIQSLIGRQDYHIIYISSDDLISNSNALNVLIDKGFILSNSQVSRAVREFILTCNIEETYGDADVNVELDPFTIATRLIPHIPYVNQIGYLENVNGYAFPEGVYTKSGLYEIILANRNQFNINEIGEYNLWKTEVADKALKGHIPTFTLIYSMASMLLPFSDLGNLFIHFFGKSSSGKSLMLQLASTIYSSGVDPRVDTGSMIQKWNTTSNALMSTVKGFDGTVLLLDELGECSAKDFENTIYQITSGVGKARATSTGKVRETDSWKILGISSGEISGLDKIKSIGNRQMEGEAIRFLDIHIQGQIFEQIKGCDNKDIIKFVDELKVSCGNHGGHASRDFIQQFIGKGNNKKKLMSEISGKMNEVFRVIDDRYDNNLSSLELRVIRHFQLIAVAGLYSIEFGILKTTKAYIYDSIFHVIDLWRSYFNRNITPEYGLTLRNYIINNQTLFIDIKDKKPIKNCAGYYREDKANNSFNYLITKEKFQEIYAGESLLDVAKQLNEFSLLIKYKDQYKKSYRVSSIVGKDNKSSLMRLYTIDSSIVDIVDIKEDTNLNIRWDLENSEYMVEVDGEWVKYPYIGDEHGGFISEYEVEEIEQPRDGYNGINENDNDNDDIRTISGIESSKDMDLAGADGYVIADGYDDDGDQIGADELAADELA